MSAPKIEYLGLNVSLDGSLIERKLYYHWESNYIELIPSSIKDYILPFDFGIRKNGDEISVSSFLRDVDHETLEALFRFINDCGIESCFDDIKSQFLYILNPNEDCHYPPIVSLKFDNCILNKISLYVAPLHAKDKMADYMSRALTIFNMKSKNYIRRIVSDLVASHICDLFMTAWDLKSTIESYKIYLKIKNLSEMESVVAANFPEIIPYIHEDGFRFCEIALSFVNDELNHYNLYFKPLH